MVKPNDGARRRHRKSTHDALRSCCRHRTQYGTCPGLRRCPLIRPVSTSTHSAPALCRPGATNGEKRGMGGSARNNLRCVPGSVPGGSGRLQGRRRARSPRVGMGTASATQRATYAFVSFRARLLKRADGLLKRAALRRFAAGALTCVSRPRAWME
jgi:hypothetical protein